MPAKNGSTAGNHMTRDIIRADLSNSIKVSVAVMSRQNRPITSLHIDFVELVVNVSKNSLNDSFVASVRLYLYRKSFDRPKKEKNVLYIYSL